MFWIINKNLGSSKWSHKSYRHWQSSCPRLRFSSLVYITICINWHMARYQLCIISIIIIIIIIMM